MPLLSTRPDDLANELQATNDEVNRLSGLLDSWQRSGNSYPDLGFFRADRAEFVYPPTEVAEFQRESTQSITSGAWNSVIFDRAIQNSGVINYSTAGAADGLFSFNRPSDGRVFLLFGAAHWNSTSGTYRSIKIESYPSTVETIMAQNDGDEIAQGFMDFYRVPAGSTGFKIRVFQQSAVGLGAMSFAIWEIDRQI